MNELIISIYDSGYGFNAVVLKDNNIEKTIKHEYDLIEYNLYDKEWNWFDYHLINNKNEKIQHFDRIIVCEDGGIDLYIKGVNY